MASERDASQAAGARYQVVVMTGSTENMEAVARLTCAKVPARDGKSEEKLAAEVEMYSHVVAAEFEVAIIDERGEYVGELDWTRKMAAYRKWMRRHQKCRGVGVRPVRGASTPKMMCFWACNCDPSLAKSCGEERWRERLTGRAQAAKMGRVCSGGYRGPKSVRRDTEVAHPRSARGSNGFQGDGPLTKGEAIGAEDPEVPIALKGHQDGKSMREIAKELYGADRVAAD